MMSRRSVAQLSRPETTNPTPSRRPAWLLVVVTAGLVGLGGCGPSVAVDPTDGGMGQPDAPPPIPCTQLPDADGDGISNGVEGCEGEPPRDSDHDGTPDFEDPDSDNDGVPDEFEDRNGDGKVGTCTAVCDAPADCDAGAHCSIAPGAASGVCVAHACLAGETDPTNPDTDGDGVPDNMEGTSICNPASADNPNGYKPVVIVDSADAVGDATPNWRIAVEPTAMHGAVSLAFADPLESAYVFDLADPTQQVAGFLVSRPATAAEIDANAAANRAYSLVDALPGAATIRAFGTRETSLDGFDTMLGTTLVFAPGGITDVRNVRRLIVEALLERTASEVTMPPIAWSGTSSSNFAVVFQTLYRPDTNQVIFMGSVATLLHHEDFTRSTSFHMDDLANGSGLTTSGNGESIECEEFFVDKVPKADIIWVVDESGSMDGDRANVASNATAFFQKAVSYGLDFRMGVTDMDITNDGQFATHLASASTGDRWILPSEEGVFASAINDPSGPDSGNGYAENGLTQGRAALSRHLPRNDADPGKVRTDAELVVIVLTDERPDEIEDAGIITDGNDGPPTAAQQAQISTFVQPYIQDYVDADAAFHLVGIPVQTPGCSSGSETSDGYLDIVAARGGQFGSICEPDLSPTIDAILDDIVGSASPIVLTYVPISASIAVAKDNVPLPRSRTMGFDYRASSNSIVFPGITFDPANPSTIVVSYRRWTEQVIAREETVRVVIRR